MASVTRKVSGYLIKPNGQPLTEGFVQFEISWPTAQGNNIVSNEAVSVKTGSDGYFELNLVPNTSYPVPTYYAVSGVEVEMDSYGVIRKGNTYSFGKARLLDYDSDIQDILSLQMPKQLRDYFELVRGDTINWVMFHVDDIGKAVDISSSTASVIATGPDGVDRILDVEVLDADMGKILISSDTDDYPYGWHTVKVKFTTGGIAKTQIGKVKVI